MAPELLLVVLALINVLCFFMGKIYQSTKVATQTSQLAMFASIWAATEARAVGNAPVIQRIIDRMHMVKPPSDEQTDEAKQMNDDFEDALEGVKREIKKRKENQFDEDDLV